MKSDLFSKYARTYDRYALIQKKTADWIMNLLNFELKQGAHILDYGCGTGILTSLLQKQFPKAYLQACDISEAMLLEAGKKIELKNIDFFLISPDPGIKGIIRDPYDLIVSNAVLHWLNEDDFLKMLAETLHSGGRIFFTAYGPDSFSELTLVLEQYFKRKIRLPVSYFKDQKSWEKLLSSSFKNWNITKKKYSFEYRDIKQLFRTIKFTGTTSKGLGFSHFWTPGDLKSIEKIFISMYKSITCSYEIFLCSAFKQE